MFKNFFILSILLISGLSLFSCDSTSGAESQLTEEDFENFTGLNMNQYDLPITIMLPDETAKIGASTKPEITHVQDDFKWDIEVGPNFHMNVIDWGSETKLVEQEKRRLKNTSFLSVKYVIDEPGFIMYEQVLKVNGRKDASSKVGIEHKTYHVYAEKMVNDIMYVFKSRDEGFEKVIIDLMVKTIRSVEELKK